MGMRDHQGCIRLQDGPRRVSRHCQPSSETPWMIGDDSGGQIWGVLGNSWQRTLTQTVPDHLEVVRKWVKWPPSSLSAGFQEPDDLHSLPLILNTQAS
jgi:hypothetical protein